MIPLVRLRGDSFAMGFQHGAARAVAMHAFLADGLCRLNRVMERPTTAAALAPMVAAYGAAINAAVPAFGDELQGLAEGAGVSRAEATLLQIRREVMGYRKVATAGDCTTYARSGPACVLAQTIDLNSDLEDHLCVLDVAGSHNGRRALVLTFTGLLGYLGMNEDGLAVGLNLVLGGQWKPGLPPYLAIRYLLENAGTVDGAIRLLRRLPLSSSRSLTLCDARTAAFVEILDDQMRVVEVAETIHTNHFLHPEFAASDQVNVFSRNSSRRRLQACRERLARLPDGCGAQDHFAVLSEPPIFVHDEGDIRREHTVATVVMQPAHGLLHVRPGGARVDRVQTFAFAALSEAASQCTEWTLGGIT
jgi:hypothetical protein